LNSFSSASGESPENSLATQLDPRFLRGLDLFNQGEWYAAHDVLEELWHETSGPERRLLQGLIQVSVAQVHLQNGNQRGATILFGEGLGRISGRDVPDLGLDLERFRHLVAERLRALQAGENPDLTLPPLRLLS
jgi:predicted metal-dependent hydrolase